MGLLGWGLLRGGRGGGGGIEGGGEGGNVRGLDYSGSMDGLACGARWFDV